MEETPPAEPSKKTKPKQVVLNIMEESPPAPAPRPPSIKLKRVKLNIIEPVNIDELNDNI
jgi:hypothetical protein